MKNNKLVKLQPYYRKCLDGRVADLPAVARKLGYALESDSYRGWRIPGHGGLVLWRTDSHEWRWKKFSTNDGGDAISFLTDFHGVNHKEAVEILTRSVEITSVDSKPCGQSALVTSKYHIKKNVTVNKVPPACWQEQALKLVEEAEQTLWEDKDSEVWKWLRSRGLKNNTIRKARLGLVPENKYLYRTDWGLDPIEDRPLGLWVSEGLLIPHFDHAGNTVALRIRRFVHTGPKYYTFPGSCVSSLILGSHNMPVVIIESFLDAWLVHQEAGDIVAAAALGSSGGKPDTTLTKYMTSAPMILVALDSDTAGNNASKWWRKSCRKAKYWPVPWAKDPSEAFGGCPELIRKWIKAGVHGL